MDYETNRIITQEELNKMGEELSNCAESLIDQQFKKISNDMDYEKKYKEALELARDYHEKGYFMINAAIEKIFPELKQGGHKFNIGDIISNGKVEFRVDNIVKNCIGQDSYFLVNVNMEKNGVRYLIVTDSEGKTSHMGETTWLCEQVDRLFNIKED